MRTRAYSWLSVVSFASVLAAGFVGACGGNVLVDGATGGTTGGVGGSGGAAVSSPAAVTGTSNVATTGATTGATSTGPTSTGPGAGPSATSSTGGGNDCEKACQNASNCGADLCAQFGVDCANPSPMFACPEMCIAAASCDDIQKLTMQNFMTPLGFCLLGCQGMGPGTTGVGSTGSGPMACGQCLQQSCGGKLQACAFDAGPNSTHCASWLQCQQKCNQVNPPDPACYFSCDMQFASAAPKYQPLYDCSCTSCPMECGASDPCSHVGGSAVSASSTGP